MLSGAYLGGEMVEIVKKGARNWGDSRSDDFIAENIDRQPRSNLWSPIGWNVSNLDKTCTTLLNLNIK